MERQITIDDIGTRKEFIDVYTKIFHNEGDCNSQKTVSIISKMTGATRESIQDARDYYFSIN